MSTIAEIHDRMATAEELLDQAHILRDGAIKEVHEELSIAVDSILSMLEEQIKGKGMIYIEGYEIYEGDSEEQSLAYITEQLKEAESLLWKYRFYDSSEQVAVSFKRVIENHNKKVLGGQA